MYGFSNLSWDILAPFHLGDLTEVQVFQRVVIRRRNWSHRVKCFFDVKHRNSCFLAGWRTQTMRHLFFHSSFIHQRVGKALLWADTQRGDDTFCSCSSPSADPRSCVPTRAEHPAEIPLPKQQSCFCASTVRKAVSCIAEVRPGVPCAQQAQNLCPVLHQMCSSPASTIILPKGATPQLWLLLLVFEDEAWLQKLRDSKKSLCWHLVWHVPGSSAWMHSWKG